MAVLRSTLKLFNCSPLPLKQTWPSDDDNESVDADDDEGDDVKDSRRLPTTFGENGRQLRDGLRRTGDVLLSTKR